MGEVMTGEVVTGIKSVKAEVHPLHLDTTAFLETAVQSRPLEP
jgi:hypothetical protein